MSVQKTNADLMNDMLRQDFIDTYVDDEDIKPGSLIISKDIKKIGGPGKVTPILLILDVSGSTSKFIDQMNKGVHQFICDCMNDEKLAYDGHLAIVTFNEQANVLVPFTKLCYMKNIPSLFSGGGTDIAAGINTGLDLFEEYYKEMRGIPKNRAIVVTVTDGQIDEDSVVNKAATRCVDLVKANKILSFPAAIDDALKDPLRKFSIDGQVFSFKGSDFVKFMQTISYISSTVDQKPVGGEEKKVFNAASALGHTIIRD
jgi:uncharacterized protein YegL